MPNFWWRFFVREKKKQVQGHWKRLQGNKEPPEVNNSHYLYVKRNFNSLVLSTPEGEQQAIPRTPQPGTNPSCGHIWMVPTSYDSQMHIKTLC